MTRERVWMMFGVAWLFAGLVSWIVYRQITHPSSRDVIQVAGAARPVPVGQKIVDADLKIMEVARKDLPAGAILHRSEAVGRAVLFQLEANEPILDSKLAQREGGEGLTAMIEPGKRAVSVQANETIGVAGFVQPGSKVDVLFTRSLQNGDAATTTILQNVAVLAYGRNLQRPTAASDAKQPAQISGQGVTVTLLVTQEEAERVALAVQRGKIQLALRNPMDNKQVEQTAVYADDLGIAEPVKNVPRPQVVEVAAKPVIVAAPLLPAKPKDPKEGKVVIKVFRGNKASEEIF
jgi:pilus assembly protein CpaB